MITTLGGALSSELIVLAQERRQLERLQVMSEQKLGASVMMLLVAEEFMTLRRLLEARMGKQGKREFVQVLRLMEAFSVGHSKILTNGIRETEETRKLAKNTTANGMGCLAAQLIHFLKTEVGNIYLEAPGGEISDWVEYVYIVRGKEGEFPTIECSTQSGPFPFNLQEDKIVFPATPAPELAKKLAKQGRDKAKARAAA
jgi:hypothetical protein